jgi:integrase
MKSITVRQPGNPKEKRKAVLVVTDAAGDRRQQTFPSLAHADIAMLGLRRELAERAILGAITFAAAAAALLADPEAFRGGGEGLDRHIRWIGNLVDDTPIADFTVTYLVDLFGDFERRSNTLAAARNRMRVVLRVVAHARMKVDLPCTIRHLRQLPMLPKSDVAYGSRAPHARVHDHPDLSALVDRLAMATGILRVLLHLLVLAGLRIGEALGLRRIDVKFKDRILRIRHSLRADGSSEGTKTRAGFRQVPMSKRLEAILRGWLAEGSQKPNRRVLEDTDGKSLTYGRAYSMHRRFEAEHGLPHVRFHSHRHACVSIWIAAGIDLRFVQKWIGHADLSTTVNTYAYAVVKSARPVGATRPPPQLIRTTGMPSGVARRAHFRFGQTFFRGGLDFRKAA